MTIIGTAGEDYLVSMSRAELDSLAGVQFRHGGYGVGSEIDIGRACDLLETITNNKDRLIAIHRDVEFLIAAMDEKVVDAN